MSEDAGCISWSIRRARPGNRVRRDEGGAQSHGDETAGAGLPAWLWDVGKHGTRSSCVGEKFRVLIGQTVNTRDTLLSGP